MRSLRVLIPAGGRSSRSGLNYPKTLYRIGGVPILIRICKLVEKYDNNPIIIVNPAFREQFQAVMDEFEMRAEFVFQEEPKGMGDAVLYADRKIDDAGDILLIWSDIPMLSEKTLDSLVNFHQSDKNNFSFATSIGNNCYTIVERKNGKITRVKETRALGIQPAKYGERDIGLFVFRKKPLFEILKKDSLKYCTGLLGEHGFLYAIEKLCIQGEKVEGYPIALPSDCMSFNTPEELKAIEDAIGK